MHKTTKAKYSIPGVSFEAVYNRNEKRVLRALKLALLEQDTKLTAKDTQDAYALALNRIPAHYVHRGTIVLRSNFPKSEIMEIVRECVALVRKSSKI